MGYACGLERISHFRELQRDPLFAAILAGEPPSSISTLYRSLDRFTTEAHVLELGQANTVLLDSAFNENRDRILDIDTTVETVYGNQEGAAVGYNPNKPGRKSYQAVLAFDGESQAVINVMLHSGKSPNWEEKVAFLNQSFALLPEGRQVKFVRGDSGITSDDLITSLEADGISYVLKMRITDPLVHRTLRGVYWKTLPSSDETVRIQVGVVGYQAPGWKRHRRVVLVRMQRVRDCMQTNLFGADWEYQAIVTDVDWNPEDVWRFYNQRCTSENYIKELKYGLHIDNISKNGFYANYADLWLKAMGYNLLLILKTYMPEVHQRISTSTVQRLMIRIPAQLVWHARRWSLRLAEWWPHKGAWLHLQQALDGG